MMAHSGTVPGALPAEDVQAALARLGAAVAADAQLPEPEESAQAADDELAVSLPHRALPLIELLGQTARAKCDVMGNSNR